MIFDQFDPVLHRLEDKDNPFVIYVQPGGMGNQQ